MDQTFRDLLEPSHCSVDSSPAVMESERLDGIWVGVRKKEGGYDPLEVIPSLQTETISSSTKDTQRTPIVVNL